MIKKPKSKQKSVAEKVAELIAHPNQSGSDSEEEHEATAPRVVDFDEDEYQIPAEGTSEFRKRNVKLLSEQSSKYKGKIVTRKDFEDEELDDDVEEEEDEYEDSDEDLNGDGDDSENDYDSKDNDESLKAFSMALKKSHKAKATDEPPVQNDEIEEEEYESDDEDESGDDEDEDEDDYESEEEPKVISQVNHEAEIQKGFSVQNQLRVWERLLELRINCQKVLSKANQLPESNELKALGNSVDQKNKNVINDTCKQTQILLHHLITLQNSLITQYPETNKAMNDCLKRPSPFKDIAIEGEPPLKQANLFLQQRFETFRGYRNAVLLKWDDRTKLLTPGAGGKKKTLNEDYDVIKKINNALANKSLLIQKSQQIKSNTQQTAKTGDDLVEEQEEEKIKHVNVYDDSDFYHQQLRELIEYKANTSSNMSEVTKQYMELQKLRQKMKKKVDTRASKGRKLRYVVHNKLINFMAPHDNFTWTDESKEELCKSLFV